MGELKGSSNATNYQCNQLHTINYQCNQLPTMTMTNMTNTYYDYDYYDYGKKNAYFGKAVNQL